jgi:hypothetical protein
MKRMVYKVTLLHEDVEGAGPHLIGEAIDRPNTEVMDVEPKEIDWVEARPLLQQHDRRARFNEMFKNDKVEEMKAHAQNIINNPLNNGNTAMFGDAAAQLARLVLETL